jgi:hypothetical protein
MSIFMFKLISNLTITTYFEKNNNKNKRYDIVKHVPKKSANPEHIRITTAQILNVLRIRGSLFDEKDGERGDEKREAERDTRSDVKPSGVFYRQIIEFIVRGSRQRMIDGENRRVARVENELEQSVRDLSECKRWHVKRLIVEVGHNFRFAHYRYVEFCAQNERVCDVLEI